MGKNKKSKQVVHQSSSNDYEDIDKNERPSQSVNSCDIQVLNNNKDSKTSKDFTFSQTLQDSKIVGASDQVIAGLNCINCDNGGDPSDLALKISNLEITSSIGNIGDEKESREEGEKCTNNSCDVKNECNNQVNGKEKSNIDVNSFENIHSDSCDNAKVDNSSPSSEIGSQGKSQKKKKKQKLKKLDTNFESRSHQSSTSSCDNSPTECPFSSLSEADCNEDQKQKKEQERKRPSKKQLAAIHEALKKAKEEEDKRKHDEEQKMRQAEEAERLKLEQLRLEQERKDKKKLKEKLKKEKLKAEGRLLSKSQKQARARMQATIEIYRQQGVDIPQIGEKLPRGNRIDNSKNYNRRRLDSAQSDRSDIGKSERVKTVSISSQESKDSISDIPSSFESKESVDQYSAGSLATESDLGHFSCSEESDALDEDHLAFSDKTISEARKLKKPKTEKMTAEKLEEKKNEVKLRSPVVCVLGHVDTGKTKILDYIRKTHVQDSEAGGITQQIGATMIPQSALKEKCKMVKDFSSFNIQVPGLLVIDTPGHESFKNLRSRGSCLCDIAILVVDIMHGLQPQTLESINLLKANKIPFVVALNKVDRIYGWKTTKDIDIVQAINDQSDNTLWVFQKRCQEIVQQFANECLNAALFYENNDPRAFISMIPMSAISGDGMGNLLFLLTQLTQTLMHKKLIYSNDLKATVLEVKVIPGLGTTIDVILVNGQLREGDTIILAGHDGPIVTQIRSLLMPHPLKELRVKNPYIDYKVIEGAQGVKISGKDLDKTLAGMPLYVARNPGEVEIYKSHISQLCLTVHNIKPAERGVYVQASTLGSLEALLEYLTSVGIPYFGVKIGNVAKKDVMKASIMLEHDSQYATILAFDVKVEKEAQELSDHLGVKILQADIIYHLFDMFMEHREMHLKKLEEKKHLAIFPCILTFLAEKPNEISSTIVLHVTVEAGTLKEGTPLCVPKQGNLDIGTVSSIQVNGSPVTSAKEGENAIVTVEGELQKTLELEPDDNLVSRISRQSIEVLKEYYKDELTPSDWHLMSELKKVLHPS